MPGFTEITVAEASKMTGVCEVKVDGTRMSYDGWNIISDREINRNDRFPHIVQALRQLNWKVRGEIALPHGNVLQINKKDNWANARFYLFDLFEKDGTDLSNATPEEIRDRIERINKQLQSNVIVVPRSFPDFNTGWDYVLNQKNKGNYVEGVVVKSNGRQYKVKLLTEEKLPIVGYETGSLKGAFLIERNGIIGKVSGTSVEYVQRYHNMLANGLTPYVEIEYQFLTDNGIPFQPRLRALDTLQNLKIGG